MNEEIRKQALQKRKQLSDRKSRSEAIVSQLLLFLRPEKMTGLYVPIRAEADIYSGLSAFPHLAAPLVIDRWNMEMYPCRNLKPGKFGIPEPEQTKPAECEVLLIPLAAFWKMQRIGYGGGYYDRYLQTHPSALRCGIGFDVQQIPFTPAPWDQALDLIVTESAVYANKMPESLERMSRYFGSVNLPESWIWI